MTNKNNFKKMNRMIIAVAVFAFLMTGCNVNSSQAESGEITSSTEAVMEEKTAELTDSLTDNADDTDSTNNADAVIASPVSNLTAESAVYTTNINDLFTERDLRTEYDVTAQINLDEVTDSVLSITQEGVYELTGTLADGQILINTDGKVQLVLNNANITCSSGSAIYIESAKKVFITMAENSQNTVSDGSSYADISETAPDAAIYSKDSLTINGTGVLTVNGNYNEGITSKDDLVIAGGTINVTSVGNGIKGKDSVSVYDGTINITSGGDGLKSSNDTDEGMGFIYIRSGKFNIDAQEDGIQAESELIILDGDFTVKSGGGTENAPQKMNNDFGGGFGRGGWNQQEFSTEASEEDTTPSVKGIKAGSLLYISGGTLSLDTADDALHSNDSLYICGGQINLSAGDKGIHADADVTIAEGTVNITKSYEGIEANDILISGGTVYVTSSDDGFNASDGVTNQDGMGVVCDCTLEISGGYVYVNADGDGLDSNGSITINGGTVIVDGPTNDGNGALDSNNGITMNGGFLIAAGSSGMAEYPDDGTQNVIITTLDNYQDGGTLFTICDEDGNEILSYAPSKKYNSVIISTDALETGKTYSAYTGGSTSANAENGLYETGGYQNDGTEAGSVTLDSTFSFIGTAGGMGMGGMMGGGRGGFGGGQRPGNMELPTDENGEISMPDDFDPSQFGGDMQPPTDENGEFSMPDDFDPSQMQGGRFKGGQMPEDFELPTDENGNVDRSQMKGGRMKDNKANANQTADFGQDREQLNG